MGKIIVGGILMTGSSIAIHALASGVEGTSSVFIWLATYAMGSVLVWEVFRE